MTAQNNLGQKLILFLYHCKKWNRYMSLFARDSVALGLNGLVNAPPRLEAAHGAL